MDCEMICKWLGLPAEGWPPDHYTLLGLESGEGDVPKIEERVHERLIRIRQFQLNHPDQATEAMNRLAQAFSCLTDPQSKKTYDAALGAPAPSKKKGTPLPQTTSRPPAVEPPIRVPEAASPPKPVEGASATTPASPDPLAWLFGPWSAPATPDGNPAEPLPPTASARVSETTQPVVVDWKKEPPPLRVPSTPAGAPEEAAPVAASSAVVARSSGVPSGTVEAPSPPAPPAEPVNPQAQAAEHSPQARRGLGTKRAMYRRIATTRQLIDAWTKIGTYLGKPDRRLTRVAEANDLIRQLGAIQDLLEDFPPLLGEAGQPGYLVLALAHQSQVVPTLRALLPSQREALARDWKAGDSLLSQHRQFLRAEWRALRRKSMWGRATRALRSLLNDYAGRTLAGVGIVALLLALWTYYRYRG